MLQKAPARGVHRVAALGHVGRTVLGLTENTLTLTAAGELYKKFKKVANISHHVLRTFAELCWAAFRAARAAGPDTPAPRSSCLSTHTGPPGLGVRVPSLHVWGGPSKSAFSLQLSGDARAGTWATA